MTFCGARDGFLAVALMKWTCLDFSVENEREGTSGSVSAGSARAGGSSMASVSLLPKKGLYHPLLLPCNLRLCCRRSEAPSCCASVR